MPPTSVPVPWKARAPILYLAGPQEEGGLEIIIVQCCHVLRKEPACLLRTFVSRVGSRAPFGIPSTNEDGTSDPDRKWSRRKNPHVLHPQDDLRTSTE